MIQTVWLSRGGGEHSVENRIDQGSLMFPAWTGAVPSISSFSKQHGMKVPFEDGVRHFSSIVQIVAGQQGLLKNSYKVCGVSFHM